MLECNGCRLFSYLGSRNVRDRMRSTSKGDLEVHSGSRLQGTNTTHHPATIQSILDRDHVHQNTITTLVIFAHGQRSRHKSLLIVRSLVGRHGRRDLLLGV